jgi:hypothetical protein
VVVPVPFVVGVPVTVVHIVDVVPMGHSHVSTSLAVLVRVVAVSGVPAGLALVDMVVVDPVEVSVVGVVHVVPVRERDMAAALVVLVHVVGMGGVCSSHEIPRLPFGAQQRSYVLRHWLNSPLQRGVPQRLTRQGSPGRMFASQRAQPGTIYCLS